MRVKFYFLLGLLFFFPAQIAFADTQAPVLFGSGSSLLPLPDIAIPVPSPTTSTIVFRTALPTMTVATTSVVATTSAISTSAPSAPVPPPEALRSWEVDVAVNNQSATPTLLTHVFDAQQQLLAIEPLKNLAKTKPEKWDKIYAAVWKDGVGIQILTLPRVKGALKVDAEGNPKNIAAVYGAGKIFSSSEQDLLAVRYPVFRKISSASYSAEEIVYTPYSTALFRQPEIIAYGKTYYDQLVKTVFTDLNRRGVRSAAFPEKLLTQVVDQDLAKSILAIEHVDEGFLKSNQQHALDRFYVLLALNGDRAYAYARSSVGASGAAQFMPKTYASLVRSRPGAGLEVSFTSGTRSLQQSLLAQMLYLDLTLRDMPIDVREGYFIYPQESREFLVAAYNGGLGRVRPLISYWRQVSGIASSQFSLSDRKVDLQTRVDQYRTVLASTDLTSGLKKSYQAQLKEYQQLLTTLLARTSKPPTSLRKETQAYVRKYRLVESFFQAPSYAGTI